ncbi:MAG: hypothetical protein COA44_13075 [Arcobacter sp.]|nr:MAG: hypothetical protein COA44_13075 [Arcobacter sp.]
MTIDLNRLPKTTEKIFNSLREGSFITNNNPEISVRNLYHDCDRNFEYLLAYFQVLGYELVQGDGYFIFNVTLDDTTYLDRISRIETLLRLVDLFRGTLGTFEVGQEFSPSELELGIKNNISYEGQIRKIQGVKKDNPLDEQCKSVFSKLKEYGIIVLSDTRHSKYKVLSSYNYLIDFFETIKKINISEELEGEE